MTASILDGKAIANRIKQDIKASVLEFKHQTQRTPALAVILVGEDKASQIYVTNKRQACDMVGITSIPFYLPADTSQHELQDLIHQLNANEAIDGILIQLPLPPSINTEQIIETIDPCKDVDGFHPYNFGHLAQRSPLLRPCTPMGIMRLLEAYHIDVKSKHAVVVGASNIVGRPMTFELLHAGATVTTCHRLTKHIENHVKGADILVVAAGVPDLVKPEWLNKDQIVIDVGIHRLDNGKIRGDLDFNAVSQIVSWLTPVPGGVGPMTIVSLLENTLLAATMLSHRKDHNAC